MVHRLLAAMGDPVVVVGPGRVAAVANRAAEVRFGY